jgi:hypothetical protein
MENILLFAIPVEEKKIHDTTDKTIILTVYSFLEPLTWHLICLSNEYCLSTLQ